MALSAGCALGLAESEGADAVALAGGQDVPQEERVRGHWAGHFGNAAGEP